MFKLHKPQAIAVITAIVFLSGASFFTHTDAQISQTPAKPKIEPQIAQAQTSAAPIPVPQQISGLSLRIDSIGINIPLGKTALAKNRELLVPANPKRAAWYKAGPKPGDSGTALITGHLDDNGGAPGVFYNLKNLKPGDIIYVGREDGAIVKFKVNQLAPYKQDQSFPWSQVYRTNGEAGLRIITCHGAYNPKTGRYSHNLVVYASLL